MAYPVPYSAPLPFTLADGKEIIIDGVVAPYCSRFSINLCAGPTFDNSDAALHFNPRFEQNEVVRTHKCGNWGPEEKHGGFPFYRGAAFQLKIVVRHHAFQIYVNNNYFTDFNHRLAKEAVRYLYIAGDVSINRIAFSDVIINPAVPLTLPISGALQHGKQIVIQGVPRHGAQRFNVNLVCGPSFDGCDVALHFDARFNFGSCHNTVVRNHKSSGSWGGEETHANFFPFSCNTPFEIRIYVEHHGYRVTVNNQHFTEFNHRIHPVQRVSHLNIQGDVNLSQVSIQ
ncbi:galectin-4 [Biomphalaria glabrata]